MQDAVVAAENQTFWTDKGIDPKGIVRALFSNARGNARQGASTITQQYVKILYLTSEQSYKRKIKEAIVSLKIQQQLSKKEVLEGYLNTIYFGRGAYGIQAASKAYFDHPAKDLTLRESAVLATVLNNPSKFDPANGKEAKRGPQGPLRLRPRQHGRHGARSRPSERDKALKRLPKFPKIAAQSQFGGQKGHMLALVKQEMLSARHRHRGGDRRRWPAHHHHVRPAGDGRRPGGRRRAAPDAGMPGPAGNKDLHIGAATVDTATGELLGFYGGQDYLESQINWARLGRHGRLDDEGRHRRGGHPRRLLAQRHLRGQQPHRHRRHRVQQPGRHRLRLGRRRCCPPTENSINTAFVDMVDSMDDGPQKIIQAARGPRHPGQRDASGAGIPRRSIDFQENVGVTLGTAQVSPINMANAYATLANGGCRATRSTSCRRSSTRAARSSTRPRSAATGPSTPTSPPT